jgi:hypothetical protein
LSFDYDQNLFQENLNLWFYSEGMGKKKYFEVGINGEDLDEIDGETKVV